MKPLYRNSLDEAQQCNEAEDWCESHKENIRCRNFLDDQVRHRYKNNTLPPECVENTVAKYGYDRTMWVIANTIVMRHGDAEFSDTNQKWAKGFNIQKSDTNYEFSLDSYSCLVDKLADYMRKMYQSLNLFGNAHIIHSSDQQDYTGKLLILRATSLKDEYRTPEYQLFLAESGFGCSPTALGTKVYGKFLFDGEEAKFYRMDFVGIIADEHIPDWAREKLAEISAQQNNSPEMGM